ncbi:hypothetical protein I2494_07495 [Budviciaceae bacterium BWR-B9]|uniref:Uncharacterized protein n=1 Tax=Limnobaculum allomyrinae TaxID=2791986 RepID=A0ABS1IP95_9GAMM|nr:MULTISPECIES: hypothetical protein [Limnobaculum]MBK5143559.1 hypothetical protein [Limnobaculum allomyrinae]MBV7691447.1 hypothetical protein [Limnobaculum sp. M2-1]
MAGKIKMLSLALLLSFGISAVAEAGGTFCSGKLKLCYAAKIVCGRCK